MPLKEQNGNSQGTTGSQHAKPWRDVKPDIKPDVRPDVKPDVKPDIKPDIKAVAHTPLAASRAGLSGAPACGGGKPAGLPMQHRAAPGKPVVMPKLPAASNRLAAFDEGESGLGDITSTLMSRDELKRSLERRKKRKERAALAAAGN